MNRLEQLGEGFGADSEQGDGRHLHQEQQQQAQAGPFHEPLTPEEVRQHNEWLNPHSLITGGG